MNVVNWITEFFNDISWITWAGLLVSYFFLNVLYTMNALYTYRLKALSSANTGVLIYILGYIGIALFMDTPNNIIPILIASWLGEYYTIIWEIKKINKAEQKKSDK